jgi:glutathione peroxidase
MLILLMLFNLFASTQNSLFDFKGMDIDGKPIDFSQFKGKKILVVNVASECGYTPQYEGLQQLYEKYKDKLMIIGFPANNFGQQEPGTNKEIQAFCKKNYGVTFQMMNKVSVKGDDINPIFRWLTSEPNPDFTGDIKWNFEKFLLDENGKLIHRYRSKTEPMSEVVTKAIEEKQ